MAMSTTRPTPAASEHAKSGGDLILRDHLAIDRTVLANERTLLAYGRTALTLLIVGFSFLHVPLLQPGGTGTPSIWYRVGAVVFLVGSALVAGIGAVQYVRCRQRLNAIQGPAGVGTRGAGYWPDPPAAA